MRQVSSRLALAARGSTKAAAAAISAAAAPTASDTNSNEDLAALSAFDPRVSDSTAKPGPLPPDPERALPDAALLRAQACYMPLVNLSLSHRTTDPTARGKRVWHAPSPPVRLPISAASISGDAPAVQYTLLGLLMFLLLHRVNSVCSCGVCVSVCVGGRPVANAPVFVLRLPQVLDGLPVLGPALCDRSCHADPSRAEAAHVHPSRARPASCACPEASADVWLACAHAEWGVDDD